MSKNMESTKSTSRYILTALAVILVITAFVLVALNALNLDGKFGGSSGGSGQDQYKRGYLAAREKYKGMCPMVEKRGNTLSGKVLTVEGDALTVAQETFDTVESVDGVKDARTVRVTSATKIEAQSLKPETQLSKEMAAYKPGADVAPPSPNILSAIRLSDIKPGDQVIITADQEDVRLSQDFAAVSVKLVK